MPALAERGDGSNATPAPPVRTLSARRGRAGERDSGRGAEMAGPAMTEDGDAAWIDVSVTVRHGMPHWPDNPPIVMRRPMELLRGHACNLSHLAMGVHTGTHIDAPVHFIHQAAGVDEMPLAATMGPARVIEIADPRVITADELRGHSL